MNEYDSFIASMVNRLTIIELSVKAPRTFQSDDFTLKLEDEGQRLLSTYRLSCLKEGNGFDIQCFYTMVLLKILSIKQHLADISDRESIHIPEIKLAERLVQIIKSNFDIVGLLWLGTDKQLRELKLMLTKGGYISTVNHYNFQLIFAGVPLQCIKTKIEWLTTGLNKICNKSAIFDLVKILQSMSLIEFKEAQLLNILNASFKSHNSSVLKFTHSNNVIKSEHHNRLYEIAQNIQRY